MSTKANNVPQFENCHIWNPVLLGRSNFHSVDDLENDGGKSDVENLNIVWKNCTSPLPPTISPLGKDIWRQNTKFVISSVLVDVSAISSNFLNLKRITNLPIQWRIQNFWGGQLPRAVRKPISLQNFCQKLH